MYDIDWEYGQDIVINELGDLNLVSGVPATNQEIIRLTFTVAGNYMQHPDYGVGAGTYVGQNLNSIIIDKISNAVLNGLRLIPGIAKTPTPIIDIQQSVTGDVICSVRYYNIQAQQNIIITFKV